MGILNNFLNNRLTRFSESSTTSGIGKEEFMDWSAMTQEQGGYFSALTMSRNLRGAALSFRCKPNSPKKIFTLSMSGESDKYLFETNKRYKVRLQFGNMVVLYATLHAYKPKHATIVDISEKFIENMSDSQRLKIEFVGEDGKNISVKFSLKGAASSIDSTIERSNEHKIQINSWLMSTAHHVEVPNSI
ncbi:MAG: hypothetical protein ACC651_09225 [Candidatus Scalindua sp.]